jgi:hypothetical protein
VDEDLISFLFKPGISFNPVTKPPSCRTTSHILLHTSLYFTEQWNIFLQWIDIPGRGSSNMDDWDSESPQLQKNLVLSLVPETLQEKTESLIL